MGQGTGAATAGDEGGQTGMGIGLLGNIFGAGGQTSPSTTPYYIENPQTGHDSGPGLWQRIGTLLQDPQVQQSLKGVSDTAQHIGKAINSADKIPPPAAQMIQQAIAAQGVQGRISGMGDIPAFSPPQAAALLQSMGINIGGSSSARGGGPGGWGSLSMPVGSPPAQVPPMPNNPSRY